MVFEDLPVGMVAPLPTGLYRGHAWSPTHPRLVRLLSRVWKGKLIGTEIVLNRIGPFLLVRGYLRKVYCEEYPAHSQLHIQYWFGHDELRWDAASSRWAGRMQLGSMTVYFWLQEE